MAEETKIESTEAGQKTRRAFVKTAAQVAVTAPAAVMLLSATATPAGAQVSVGYATANHVLDDFTYGNTHEDIDGGPSLDDVT